MKVSTEASGLSSKRSKLTKLKLAGGFFLVTLPGWIWFWVFFVPPYVTQSPADIIANQGLSSTLTELGAKGFNSVCWLADSDQKFVHQYLGAQESAWSRLKEKLRLQLWEREGSCFEAHVTAAVILFPYVESVESIGFSKKNAAKIAASIQRDTSSFLSQTGLGSGFEKQSMTFHLQTGANFHIYLRRTPSGTLPPKGG